MSASSREALLRRSAAEFLGTFVLIALGPGAAMVSAKTGAFGHTGVALAFGLAVTLIVAASGNLSGAHVNPAVTIGLWSVRRFPARDVVPYLVAQCLGAIAAAFTLAWLLGDVGAMGATIPTVSTARAFVIEAGYTGVLGFVILAVSADPRTPPAIAPVAIGATVFAGALVTGPLTGGSFNPARSLGPAIAGDIWTVHWLYWVAPIVGIAFGMRCYEMLRDSTARALR